LIDLLIGLTVGFSAKSALIDRAIRGNYALTTDRTPPTILFPQSIATVRDDRVTAFREYRRRAFGSFVMILAPIRRTAVIATLALAAQAFGTGCTRNYYYGATPGCVSDPGCGSEPVYVNPGSLGGTPTRIDGEVGGLDSTRTTIAGAPKSSRVIVSEPLDAEGAVDDAPQTAGTERTSRRTWIKNDRRDIATTTINGSMNDETIDR
jgi:hypothetical protein